MKIKISLTVFAIALAVSKAFGLGGEYSNDRPVNEPSWPEGMRDLVNITNRVGGFFVNEQDVFFFSGTASNFNLFLGNYSKVQAIEKHRLILHPGVGEASSLGGGNRRPCDWKLTGCPGGWLGTGNDGIPRTPQDTNYVLEMHFWTGGKIPLDKVLIPQNVEMVNPKTSIGSTAQSAAIDQLAAYLSDSHGLWVNGIFPFLDLPKTASTEEVIAKIFRMTGVANGRITEHKILEIREVRIKGSLTDLYTAARVQTDLGEKIVLFQNTGTAWWSRVYDANQTNIYRKTP